jgi:hypothetical protein
MNLKLNEEKTRGVNIEEGQLNFLGFNLKYRQSKFDEGKYLHIEPSRKAIKKVKEEIK